MIIKLGKDMNAIKINTKGYDCFYAYSIYTTNLGILENIIYRDKITVENNMKKLSNLDINIKSKLYKLNSLGIESLYMGRYPVIASNPLIAAIEEDIKKGRLLVLSKDFIFKHNDFEMKGSIRVKFLLGTRILSSVEAVFDDIIININLDDDINMIKDKIFMQLMI